MELLKLQNQKEMLYLCMKLHFKVEEFGIQSDNVTIPIMQASLREKKKKEKWP